MSVTVADAGRPPMVSAFGATGVPLPGAPAFGMPAFGMPAFGMPAFGMPAFGMPAFGMPAFGTPVFTGEPGSMPGDGCAGCDDVLGLEMIRNIAMPVPATTSAMHASTIMYSRLRFRRRLCGNVGPSSIAVLLRRSMCSAPTSDVLSCPVPGTAAAIADATAFISAAATAGATIGFGSTAAAAAASDGRSKCESIAFRCEAAGWTAGCPLACPLACTFS